MGRKKKKKAVQDARGYQQGASQSKVRAVPPSGTTRTSAAAAAAAAAPPPPPRARKAPPSKTPATKGDLSITASLFQDLEDLLSTLRSKSEEHNVEKSSSTLPTTNTTEEPADRFRKRIASLYDRLTALGFEFSFIQRAVRALGYAASYETALDWLCVHLKTAELPTLFTEGKVRDGVTATTALTVLKATASKPATENFSHEENADLDFVREMEKQSISRRKESSSEGCGDKQREDDADKAAQKAWLLQQYQYEEEEKEITKEGTNDTATAGSSPATDQQNEQPQTPDTPLISPEEKQLQEIQAELDQLEADLKDEAGNYMRSKHEIKEMQKNAKILRKQVQGMERKIAKVKAQQREEAAKQVPVVASNEAEEEGRMGMSLFGGDEEEEEEEEDMMASLDMFSSMEVTTEANTIKVADDSNEGTSTVVVPKDSIPRSWTGKTPKVILEEWCRKEKLPRPTFQKRGYSGCSLRVKLDRTGQKAVEMDQDAGSYVDAQHFVATRAMYEINPELPLYRILPPFHRDAWLSWVEAVRIERKGADQAADGARQAKIEELIHSVSPASLAEGTAKSHNSETFEDRPTSTGEGILESWDDVSDMERPTSQSTITEDKAQLESMRLRKAFEKRQRSPQYQEMLEARQALPVFTYQQDILESLAKHPVTIISAETGAGKTTQVPQFILTKALREGQGGRVSILCTQPRRVAATSVAERVSDEMAESAIGGLVGYQIRLEAKKSKATRLLFCTTGVVLRQLVDNPTLEGISHVVVDEVHERQWQIDLLLVSLRTLLRGPRPDLKIVLMSATLNAGLFSAFFGGAPLLTVPGRTFPVANYYLEDLIEKTGHIVEEGSRCAKRGYGNLETVSLWVTTRGGDKRKETAAIESETDVPVSDDFVGYSLPARRSMDRVDESIINYDLIEDILALVCVDQPDTFVPPEHTKIIDGAILIFLPGLGEIRSLAERLLASRVFGNQRHYEIIPMHSTLSASDQQRAFRRSQKGVRKLILSTNIAETSVTIPGVTCVIDSGLVREIQRDKRTGTQKLVSTWCSRANAKQRCGRAGRLHPGVCLKLFSSRTEATMKKTSEPELRRIPLEEICLTVLATGLATSCRKFLSETPEPPLESAIDFALESLRCIGAITISGSDAKASVESVEKLTPLGLHLTKLPIDARLGKLLIFGCIFKCLGSALTVAAFLSASQSPFSSSVTESNLARAAHASFSDASSDFLRLLNVWEAYAATVSSGRSASRRFCHEKYLNYNALREIGEARQQFLDLLCGIGFVRREEVGYHSNSRRHDEKLLLSSSYCTNDKKDYVVHCVVCAGLYPNIARLTNENIRGERSLMHKTEKLVVHSKSVNSKLSVHTPSMWMAYHEKLGTGRRVSISTTCFVHPFSLMIFGPSLKVLHTERRVLVDEWIDLSFSAKTGVVFREIREHVDIMLKGYVQSISERRETYQESTASQVVDRIVDVLCQG